jgi:hypothetical protein
VLRFQERAEEAGLLAGLCWYGDTKIEGNIGVALNLVEDYARQR